MRFLLFLLIGICAALNYALWLGEDGWHNMQNRRQAALAQQQKTQAQAMRNQILRLEVEDLAQGGEALSERARAGSGYIGKNETFYRIVP